MRRKRGGLLRMLGYEPYIALARQTQSRPVSEDKCQDAKNDEATDSSSLKEKAKDDGVQYEPQWVEHHGQLHRLDHDEWEATTLRESHTAKDGTVKPVDKVKVREEYL